MKKFMNKSRNPNEEQEEEEEEEVDEEIELGLGLSMNGRFGVDPMKKKLKRSSSLVQAPLCRTRSLPTVAEEWRRRKEFQTMRRMEARRKRMEKLRSGRVMREKDVFFEDVNNGTGLGEVVNGRRVGNGIVFKSENGSEMLSSQGSIGSQRSGSSGISDVEFQPAEGAKQNGDAPPSQDAVEEEQASRAGNRGFKLTGHALRNAMLDMPYVATKGDGPNRHRIEGFLYKYEKGEVRILCVCHGLFLTPAEFVKHGGGPDVEHPLKHIVVNPFPLV